MSSLTVWFRHDLLLLTIQVCWLFKVSSIETVSINRDSFMRQSSFLIQTWRITSCKFYSWMLYCTENSMKNFSMLKTGVYQFYCFINSYLQYSPIGKNWYPPFSGTARDEPVSGASFPAIGLPLVFLTYGYFFQRFVWNLF